MRSRLYYTWLGVLTAVLIGLVPFGPAAALGVPELKGHVNDYAGLLSRATEKALVQRLQELAQTDSTQIVVLTIPSLKGDNLEAFSMRVVESWQLGQKGLDNGALLLVAKNDRKIRIEVGYGLEGRLTDLMSGRIIRHVILPAFKNGNFDQGVIAGVEAMIGVVRSEYQAEAKPAGGKATVRDAGIFALFPMFFLLTVLGRLNRPLGIAAGGVLLPLIGFALLQLGLFWVLALVPVGAALGVRGFFLVKPLRFGIRVTGGGRGVGYWGGGGTGGGFSSGGFGGFSGGGGGFGGGGASGSW
jgi:uncharacterized protein